MDRILEAFLKQQLHDGLALAADSDLLELLPVGTGLPSAATPDGAPVEPTDLDPDCPPSRYLAQFTCRGLVREGGAVVEANSFTIGIWFPPDYLRRASPFQTLTWLHPRNIYHPNISDHAPFICIGHLSPGTPLVDILYQCFEIITFNKVTMREDDALNKAACAWARHHQHRFPVDARPLKRRRVDIHVEELP